MINGGPVDLTHATKYNVAIMWAGYPGKGRTPLRDLQCVHAHNQANREGKP